MDKLNHKIIDCHTHLSSIGEIDGFLEFMNATGVSAVNLLALVNPRPAWWALPDTPAWRHRGRPRDVSINVGSMMLKALHPERIYVFGGLDHNTPAVQAGQHDYVQQAHTLIEMGVDGFKMWEGGFYTRQQTGLPLDAPEYDAYYSLLESAGLPILYHVNAQYRPEIDGLLPKHPNLKIIFAHFYGGSRGLQRLRRFLDRWPNTYVDLAPGMIFRGLSENCHEAHQFFTEYADRILFGTDASASTPQSVERSKLLVRFLRRILERKDNLDLAEIGVFEPEENDPTLTEQQRLSRQEFWAEHGLYLDDEVLERIYAGNFARVVGSDPKKANARIALTECERLLERVSQEADDYWDPEGRGSHRTDHLGELEQIAAILRTIV